MLKIVFIEKFLFTLQYDFSEVKNNNSIISPNGLSVRQNAEEFSGVGYVISVENVTIKLQCHCTFLESIL
jgi:hypothetical protein